MVKIYDHPLSPFAQKVKLALLEKGIKYESLMPNFLGEDSAFDLANPRREVPALVDDDCAVFDSTIILSYIEDKWPTPPLLPSSACGRARARQIEEVCDTLYDPNIWGINEIRVFGRASGSTGEEIIGRASGQIAGLNEWLDRQLGGQPFFSGETIGYADVAVFPFVHTAGGHGMGPARPSSLRRWLDAMLSRPTVDKIVQEASQALAEYTKIFPELIKSGMFTRLYRDHRLEWMIRSGGLDVVVNGLNDGSIRLAREIS